MRLFSCTNCSQLLYFENSHCEQCGLSLGFISEELTLMTIIKEGDDTYRLHGRDDKTLYRYCKTTKEPECTFYKRLCKHSPL
jgi:hypothetical protein